MGVYDTVNVPCPKCGERQEAQSKSGDCILAVYEMESCPADVLANVNRHAPFTCDKCGTVFEIKLTVVAQSVPLAQVGEA